MATSKKKVWTKAEEALIEKAAATMDKNAVYTPSRDEVIDKLTLEVRSLGIQVANYEQDARMLSSDMMCSIAPVEVAVRELAGEVHSISGKLDKLVEARKGNTETTYEDLETYKNKVARMLLDEKYKGARTFLQNVWKFMQDAELVTRRQMQAVDRVLSENDRLPLGSKKRVAVIEMDTFADDIHAMDEDDEW